MVGNYAAATANSGASESSASHGNDISGNEARNNIYGIYLEYFVAGQVGDNTVTGASAAGIHMNDGSSGYGLTQNVVSGDGSAGIVLDSAADNYIEGNTASVNRDGITLLNASDGNMVTGNSVADNIRYGIQLTASSDNEISVNLVTGSPAYGDPRGVILGAVCSGNLLKGNTISKNRVALDLAGAGANTADHNGISENQDGIQVAGDTNTLSSNELEKNSDAAVSIYGGAGNTLRSNTILENGYGVSIADNGSTSTGGNMLVANRFIMNLTFQARDLSAAENNFNDSSGGNSWSDFDSCRDLNRGGICDNPYQFTGGQDNKPLVNYDYCWTWYDNQSAPNWILMANPSSSTVDSWFYLSIQGVTQDPAMFSVTGLGCAAGDCMTGQVPPGETLAPYINGLMGGPVKASSVMGNRAIMSQRSLWPRGGSSIEEVLGTEASRLSSHFYWTWYDYRSAGFNKWILVANTNNFNICNRITIAGAPMTQGQGGSGVLAPGARATPVFPGIIGGPVQVEAWSDAVGGSAPADVIASQRVLTGYGQAFNAQVGTSEAELDETYYWSWYDNTSAGARNWLLVANPHATPFEYHVWIGGDWMDSNIVQPGQVKAMTFDRRGGPMIMVADDTVIASQRSTWGASFGETSGYPYSQLGSNYHWTWYDQVSQGMKSWVLIANPSGLPVDYEVRIGGQLMDSGQLNPWQMATSQFGGTMGGPVEVSANHDVIVSQRVLYNGYFNELLGTVLD